MADIKAPMEGSGFIKPKEHLGHLVMFTAVHNVEKRYDSMRKTEGEVLTVDWVCFMCGGGPNAELQLRAMISTPYVVNKIYRDGSLTLGYIVQLQAQNGNPEGAVVLNAPTDQDIQRATEWWRTHEPTAVQGAPPHQSGGAEPVDPWATGPAAATAAPVAATQAAPSGGSWGTTPPPAAPAAAPPSPPSATGAQHLDETALRAMPFQAVQALVLQGYVPREAALAAGHQV